MRQHYDIINDIRQWPTEMIRVLLAWAKVSRRASIATPRRSSSSTRNFLKNLLQA